jgi:hypothetical protein
VDGEGVVRHCRRVSRATLEITTALIDTTLIDSLDLAFSIREPRRATPLLLRTS